MIEGGHGRWSVLLDLIWCEYDFTENASTLARARIVELLESDKTSKRAIGNAGKDSVQLFRLRSLEEAEKLAEFLWELAMDPANTVPLRIPA